MPSIACAGCGKTFEAKRKTAKFCSDTCRKRGSRRGKSSDQSKTDAEIGDQLFGVNLVASVKAKLEKANRLDTFAGQHALLLAERMLSPFETGSGVAALSKQLQQVMAEALDGVTEETDPLDEVSRRRAEKEAQARRA